MVRVERFYPTKLKAPENAEARLTFGEDHHVVPLDGKLPVELLLEWKGMPEGERLFLCSVKAGKSVLLHIEQPISVIDGLEARLTRLDKSDLLGKKTVEGATLAHHLGILKKLARSDPLETDYPAHRLLVEAEAIAAGKWDKKKPGQYWLALPGVTGSPVRIFVPKEAARGKPLPVVVAMHGAGGSENMFFDGYGNGLVAKLAAERGWFVLATRAGFLGGPDVPAALDALAKIHPLDLKKAFIIGHSMGAAQGVSSAGRNPERFVAVAALGGGGSFKASNAIKKLPFFVGVGEKDIAVKSGASLAARLRKAGVDARFKEYPDLEHLTVVQMALPEVFRFFDRAVKGE